MPKPSALLLALVGLAFSAGVAHAQYKWIDSDGRVGYGDMPPSHSVKLLRSPKEFARQPVLGKPTADPKQGMPLELRRAMERAPVTLYTTSNCAPCDLARQHLVRRGIPYVEKIVSTGQDLMAFSRLGFPPDTGLPVATAGSSRQVGYHAANWDDAFTNAGYPKDSRLPSGWAPPLAESLANETQTAAQVDVEPGNDGNLSSRDVLARERSSPLGRPVDEPTMRF